MEGIYVRVSFDFESPNEALQFYNLFKDIVIGNELLPLQRSADELNAAADDLAAATESQIPTSNWTVSRMANTNPNMKTTNPIIEQLKAALQRDQNVMSSAATLIRAFPQMIQKAKDDALANGATDQELAPFTDLITQVNAQADDLAAQVVANTPSDPNNPTPQPTP